MSKRTTGRPEKAANKGNSQLRDRNKNIRCSEAFNIVLKQLVKEKVCKSEADALHEALQLYALKKLSAESDFYYMIKYL